MVKNSIELVVFDTIGTTVRESQNGRSLILDAFRRSFLDHGIELSDALINAERGKTKKEAISNLLDHLELEDDLSEIIYSSFMVHLKNKVTHFSEMEGSSRVFTELRQRGIRIALCSGLPINFLRSILQHLGWGAADFDYFGSSEEIGVGRPDPAMILQAMTRLGIKNTSLVLKIGDTVADIQEGKNAGVITAAILSGTQSRNDLENAQPDYIVADIRDLLQII